MTVKELIAQEEAKHPEREIGNNVALEIWETNSSDEIYFEDCMMASGHYDYADLINANVKSWKYTIGYGYDDEIVDKLKIVIEVE